MNAINRQARNRFLNTAVMALFLMSATGCVCVVRSSDKDGDGLPDAQDSCPSQPEDKDGIQDGDGCPDADDVTFTWTFDGKRCFDVPAVTKVKIAIPGQTLENAGVYACNTSGTDGIKLLNFRGGGYTFTIQGLADNNAVLYSGSGSFTVNGDVAVHVDLTAVAGAPAYAYVTWTFPPNSVSTSPTCAQTTMQSVVITVDNDTAHAQTVACTAGYGSGSQGVLITTTAGTHTIDLAATDGSMYYYRKTTTLPVLVAGAAVSASYTLDWFVGSLPLKWSINSAVASSCAMEGISQVRIDLLDSRDQYTYGTSGVTVPCSSSGVQGTLFQFLNPDAYRVYIQGYGAGNWLYRSNFATPPTFNVAAGQFPVVDASTPTIVVTRCSTANCQ